MKNKFGLLAIVGCFLFSVILGQSQNKKIYLTGTVRDSSGALVKGAKIFIDNVETFHATNGKGHFKIKTNPKALKISVYSPNFGKAESRIENDSIVDLVLVSYEGMKTDSLFNKNVLKDVMSADYSQQTNRYKYSKYLNIYDLIRNELRTVLVRGNSIYVRGITSFRGSSQPIFVLNGFPVKDITDILPANVLSIEVLRGATAAIYGINAANGVIRIRTIDGGF